MGIEIERKFLVVNDDWRDEADSGRSCIQSYLAFGPPVSVRVRIMGDRATLNLKESTLDIRRVEYEYEIPMADAEALISTHSDARVVSKTRYLVGHLGHTWEIDVFDGANYGLVVAEIELESKDEAFERPSWVGREVSGDARYLNSSLAQAPWTTWSQDE